MKKNAVIIDLEKEITKGTVNWVTGMGRAPHQDPLLEIAFYNNVSGNAKNPPHAHALSTERLLVIEGGMTLNVEGETMHVGPFQMILIPWNYLPWKKILHLTLRTLQNYLHWALI